MRTSNFKFFILFTIVVVAILGYFRVFGQGIELIGDPEEAQSMATKWLAALAPIATFIGAVRIFAKPISTWIAGGIERVVTKAEQTESAADDKLIDAVLSSTAYFWAAWVIDYLLSVKLPAKKKS